VDVPRRAAIARYAAPAAFLLALTIGVLLVRAALGGGGGGNDGVTALTGRTATTARTTTATTTRATTAVASSDAGPTAEETRVYTIESGDTLETVAAKSGTSVDELLRLNPGIDPHALRIGQKVRIG
jgi:spore germination protein YaaH